MMRRTVLPAMVVCLLLGPAVSRGAFQLFDDFQDEALGPVNGQDGWVGGSVNTVITDPGDPANQLLYVPSSSSTLHKSLLADGLGVPDGTVRMLFLRLRVGNKQTFSVGLSHLAGPYEFSDFAPEIGMANSAQNLDLRAWDDDGGNYELLTPLQANRWYNLWVRVDTLNNSYQVWLNDTARASAGPADRLTALDGDDTFDFRAGKASALQSFYIKTAGGSSGTNLGPVHFDDIHLEVTDALNLRNPLAPVGDIDGDGQVNIFDIFAIAECWNTATGDPTFNPAADLDGDGAINIFDIFVIAENWGQ